VKPPAFRYTRPASIEEALALMASYGADAKLIAGGQSLMPMLNLRLAEPAVLVDINRLSALAGIQREGDRLRIGAMTRHRQIEMSPEVATLEPMLTRAAREIGHLAIRNRGSIGGSIAHADPSAEWPLLAIALDAQLDLRSAAGLRRVAARDFFLGPFTTTANPDEILTAIDFPVASKGSGFGFQELCRRPGDFAIVAVACRVNVKRGKCVGASLAVGGADAVPRFIPEIAKPLVGSTGEHDALREAGKVAAETVDPSSDLHASAEFRRKMVAVLSRRALDQAFANASSS
jgi:CO/xanthine dehydrogenase FAD-binding subunit